MISFIVGLLSSFALFLCNYCVLFSLGVLLPQKTHITCEYMILCLIFVIIKLSIVSSGRVSGLWLLGKGSLYFLITATVPFVIYGQ